MRKILLFLFGLFYAPAFAQSHYAGQYSLGLNYGFVNSGTNYNVNVQKLIGNKFFGMRADLDLLQQDYTLSFFGVDRYQGDFESKKVGIAGTYSLEKIIPHPFYVQLYIGGIYSNEELKSFDLPEGAMPSYNRNNFGAYGGTELEFIVFPALSVTGGLKYQNIFKSTINKEIIFGQVGAKINF